MEDRNKIFGRIEADVYKKTLLAGYSFEVADMISLMFRFMVDYKIEGGCLLMSVVTSLALDYAGIENNLIVGLSISQNNRIFFHHVWVEINKKILDIAIYGNSYFNEKWIENVVEPQVFVSRSEADISYVPNSILKNRWSSDPLSQAIGMTYYDYLNMAKEWTLVSYITNVQKDSDEWNRILEIAKMRRIRVKKKR